MIAIIFEVTPKDGMTEPYPVEPPEVMADAVAQERAYSSPVWLKPARK